MLSRRRMLAGLGGALVLGFDPASRSWIAEAQAGHRRKGCSPFDGLPDLDGMVTTDPATIAPYASDAGSIVHKTPVAVLFPASVTDIQKMVRFCQRHRIKVASRGQGHTTFGQSQVDGGLVIDMGSLNQIHSITPQRAVLDAGATWKDLTLAAMPLGLTPPVLTGYINLSIGGTLSVGGVSAAFNAGAHVDHVQEMDVVTGKGDLVRCSRQQNRDLYDACLAGLGQCGIITRVAVDLVPAKAMAKNHLLHYTNHDQFFADYRKLLERNEFDRIFSLLFPNPGGGWLYQINAVKFHATNEDPDTAFLLRNLTLPVAAAGIDQVPYLDHILAVDFVIDLFKSIGMWDGVLHPWFDMFLPDSEIQRYSGEVLAGLTPEDVGDTGFMLMFGLRRSSFKQPLFRLPEQGKWVWLFDVLTAAPAPGPNPDFERRMLARNRKLYEKGHRVGGTRYPIGAMKVSRSDWVHHYGHAWSDFRRWKQRFDPDGILAPGPGIF